MKQSTQYDSESTKKEAARAILATIIIVALFAVIDVFLIMKFKSQNNNKVEDEILEVVTIDESQRYDDKSEEEILEAINDFSKQIISEYTIDNDIQLVEKSSNRWVMSVDNSNASIVWTLSDLGNLRMDYFGDLKHPEYPIVFATEEISDMSKVTKALSKEFGSGIYIVDGEHWDEDGHIVYFDIGGQIPVEPNTQIDEGTGVIENDGEVIIFE